MTATDVQQGDRVIVEREDLPHLLVSLHNRGYQVIGPTVRESAIVYDTLNSVEDLPVGYTDEQDGGHYRLKRRGDAALFGYAVGPHSWKKFLPLPVLRLWSAQRTESGFQFQPENQQAPKLAFFGVRSCELHAIAIQDKVFLHAAYRDPAYQARREQICIIAVNCGQAGGTCFCASMHTGPKVTADFDLALTEMLDERRHCFLVEVGTALGTEILHDVPSHVASPEEIARAERWRKWDSCFTMDFSYIVGGSVRSSTKSRYRQWMTHKLASWIDQFGTSGCVGCGRCITWCPVGIDITEEVRAIRASEERALPEKGEA